MRTVCNVLPFVTVFSRWGFEWRAFHSTVQGRVRSVVKILNSINAAPGRVIDCDRKRHYKRASIDISMSTLTHSDETAAELRVPTPEQQSDVDELSEPLAEMIIQRALKNPNSLDEVHPFIRSHRQWYRNVILRLLSRIPAPDPEATITDDLRKVALQHAPEFWGDDEVRRAAGHFPLSDPDGLACQERLGRNQPIFPREGPREGSPITEESPANFSSIALMNGSARSGMCDVCAAKPVSLGQEVLVKLGRHIDVVRMRTCTACTEHIFASGDAGKIAQATWKHGKFV